MRFFQAAMSYLELSKNEILSNFLQEPDEGQLETFFLYHIVDPLADNLAEEPVLAKKLADNEMLGPDDRLEAVERRFKSLNLKLPDQVHEDYSKVMKKIVKDYMEQGMKMREMALDKAFAKDGTGYVDPSPAELELGNRATVVWDIMSLVERGITEETIQTTDKAPDGNYGCTIS